MLKSKTIPPCSRNNKRCIYNLEYIINEWSIVKISTRTQAILAATVFFFVISLFVVANAFIQSTYSQVELRQSDANVQLVTENIRYEAEQLGTKARDWAVWDDTYTFMEDKNSHYLDSVINSPTTFESLQLNGLILYNEEGKVVASQGYDLRNKTTTSLSEETLAHFSKTLSVLSNTRGGKKKQGIVLLPEGPVLVGMHTILQTNGMGFGHGTLVMIQPFDEQRIASIRTRLHLPISIWRLDRPGIEVTPDITALSGTGAPSGISRIQDSSTMSGLFLVSDIESKPALLVGVETPRTASQQMLGTLIYLIAAFAVIGIIYIIVTGFLLKRYIITPLTDLDTAMKKIGMKGDLSERLHAEGDDEITSLKESFNAMLQDLQDDETDLKKQADLLSEAHRKANLYLDIYLDVLMYEILNVTISLQAYAELIRESGDATNREYADRITSALNRNLSVIRNIETISKIYKHPPDRIPINLLSVVDKEIRKFPGIDIRTFPGDVMVTADETLGIVFYNILLNSLQFGRENLHIEIMTRDLPDGTVEVTITDNGSGIADDMKPLIFDRFMKGSDKRSSYGLGLHIVKMLIESYGGTVRADDRVPGHPDEGAAIRFTLKKGNFS
jgi:sensor domain CHASE-containing protein